MSKYLVQDNLIGLEFRKEKVVTKELLASALGSGRADVLSTPMMIALMEATCNEGIMPYLQAEFITVGTEVNIKHLKASPLNAHLVCVGKLLSIEGPFLNFEVSVWDDIELVGSGLHQRCFVNQQKFQTKTDDKLRENN